LLRTAENGKLHGVSFDQTCPPQQRRLTCRGRQIGPAAIVKGQPGRRNCGLRIINGATRHRGQNSPVGRRDHVHGGAIGRRAPYTVNDVRGGGHGRRPERRKFSEIHFGAIRIGYYLHQRFKYSVSLRL
jgi:hypothetical protein